MYIHQQPEWPHFIWNQTVIEKVLAEVHQLRGQLYGKMTFLGFKLQEEASFKVLTQDVLKTSEIEGEKFDIEQVRSSVANKLGIKHFASQSADKRIEGIVDVLLDATQRFSSPLTQKRLFQWHATLFDSINTVRDITVGKWRTKKSGPMQVVSGAIGKEKIHFEAPSYDRLKNEMGKFIKWFNTPSNQDLIIKAAIAHFWFVTIHPFDDGNGRIARAITDMLLARSENSQLRFYSMSSQIHKERNAYYEILESCQKGELDITGWLEWFLNCLRRSIISSEKVLSMVLTKARFWSAYTGEPFNERQRLIINRLFEDFTGKLTTSKWAKIAKCSQDTALRDINDLLDKGILIKENAGGRSTSYQLKLQ